MKLWKRTGKRRFFFDESRFGTHSKVGHGWFKKPQLRIRSQ
ncbi:hypothetical protein [Wolbachia endosymbiont of Oedothorax gibbosus]|nr:hypothetical protein [Wolbachia endosymbiont of Oedothorax gibbosus]